MEGSTRVVNGHYEIGMLWKVDNPQLPNNQDVALKRCQYLETRLKRDEDLNKKYQSKIEEYVEKGYASKLRPEEINKTSPTIWYLPHHPVYHQAKPGKIRIVFDAAANNLLKSVPDDNNAIQLASDLMALLQRGGFHLTKWISSSKEVLATIPESERADPMLNLSIDKLPISRALGLQCHVEEDVFQFKIVDVDKPETTRGILSTVASLYDPLGFAAPVTLLAKILLQKLWRTKAEWDEQLPEAELGDWRQWKNDLSALTKVKIPCCYKSREKKPSQTSHGDTRKCVKEIQLHNFSDTSEMGYGAASYIRTEFTNKGVMYALVFGKSQAERLQKVSIPRLELQALALSVRVCELVQHEIKMSFSKIYYWTDSKVVLKYIQTEEKRSCVYIGNHIAEIRGESEVQQWKYCPSKENPGDDASRGMKPCDMTSQCRWLVGPSFLKTPEVNWPQTSLPQVLEEDRDVLIQSNLLIEVKNPAIYELLE